MLHGREREGTGRGEALENPHDPPVHNDRVGWLREPEERCDRAHSLADLASVDEPTVVRELGREDEVQFAEPPSDQRGSQPPGELDPLRKIRTRYACLPVRREELAAAAIYDRVFLSPRPEEHLRASEAESGNRQHVGHRLRRDARDEHRRAPLRSPLAREARDHAHPFHIELAQMHVLPITILNPARLDLPNRHRDRYRSIRGLVAVDRDVPKVVVGVASLELTVGRKQRAPVPNR